MTSPQEASRIQAMFAAIASRYDLLNRLLSFGIDRVWRQEAIRVGLEHKPQTILDAATGTADLAIALKKAAPEAEVIGVDFVAEMLELGRQKITRQNLDLSLLQADGQDLPFADNSFDLVTIAYGIRNFSDRAKGLREFYRVLKPTGRLLVLEFAPPPKDLFGRLFRFYFLSLSPRIAGLICGRRDAYEYLGRSVLEFPTPESFAAMIQVAGFVKIRYKIQTLGVSALHLGEKP